MRDDGATQIFWVTGSDRLKNQNFGAQTFQEIHDVRAMYSVAGFLDEAKWAYSGSGKICYDVLLMPEYSRLT